MRQKKKKSCGCIFYIIILFIIATLAFSGLHLGNVIKKVIWQAVDEVLEDTEDSEDEIDNADKADGEDEIDKADAEDEIDKDDDDRSEDGDNSESEKSSLYYYYNILDKKEKEIYESILSGFRDMKSEIKVFVNQDDVERYVMMIEADHPELFWVDSQYKYTSYPIVNYVVIQPEYNCSLQEREKAEEQIASQTAEILTELADLDSDYARVKKVFKYLIDTVDYEIDAPNNQNMYSALVNKRSVCAGYAHATQYLLQKSGVQALYVTGEITGRGSHAWNIVKCKGQYYHVDTTFGDSNFTNADQLTDLPKELTYDYTYLCCDDDILYRNHQASKDLTYPSCNSKGYNYYIVNDRYFENFSGAVIDSMTESVEAGKRYWICQFSNAQSYKKMLGEIEDGRYTKTILKWDDSIYSLQTQYSYDDDMYTIKVWY